MRKRWIVGVLAVGFAALITNCGGGNGGGGGGTDTDVCGGASKGCIVGSVQDINGDPVSNATVTLAGTSAAANLSSGASLVSKATGTVLVTANEQGWFAADNIEEGDRVICVSALGYVELCRTVTIEGTKTTPIPIFKLLSLGPAQTIPNVENGGIAEDTSSGGRADVDFDAGDVCDSGGNPVVGDIQCYFAVVNPSTDLDFMPPTFIAISAADQRGTMVSSSMMTLICEQNGEAVNICSGQDVEMKIPIFGTDAECQDDARNPDPLDAWMYDPTTGVWQEYDLGVCNRNCGGTQIDQYYQCQGVDHLTWINGDTLVQDACLTGVVLGAEEGSGTPLVTARCWGEGWQNEVQTDANGRFCIPVPSGGYNYTCSVFNNLMGSQSQKTGTAPSTVANFPLSTCPAEECEDIGTLIFEQPLITTALLWGELPSDLDSHFVSRGGSTHVYFGDKNVDIAEVLTKGYLDQAPYIQLDTDDVTSYGPEVTTVAYSDDTGVGVADGTYRFCVRNFSGEVEGSLCDSQAQVFVNAPAKSGGVAVAQRRSVPSSCPSGENLLWQVYEVEIQGGVIVSYDNLDKIVESPSASDAAGPCFE